MATLYKTDGTTVEVQPENGSDFQLGELYRLIGCDMIEVVQLPRRDGEIMVIDEEGKLTNQPRNASASRIAWYSNGIRDDDCIVGNALVCASKELK
jgi:hypothetical protein